MDVSLPDRPVKRTLFGALEGIALGALVYLIFTYSDSTHPRFSWRDGIFFTVVGIVVCAVGQYFARGIIGACAGLVAGALLGPAFTDDSARQVLAKHHINTKATLDGITLQGTQFHIESRRGTVVLIDFWATWCPPCRAELPNLKAIYERFHEQGFEIVGVSLNKSRDDLSKFVAKEEIPWPQIYMDTPGKQEWENPLLREYKISEIPYTLLVDREGAIVASGLVGSSLDEAVEKVMAGKKPDRLYITGKDELLTTYFAAFGWLIGMLVERRLRQVGWGGKPGVAP